MTNETRTIALWGGIAVAVAIVGLVWISWRSGVLGDQQARTTQLATDLAAAQPAGVRLDQQLTAVQHSGQEQSKALDAASAVLAPELKAEYRSSDLTSAANRVATDLKALRQRAERTGVKLPASLPLEGGLDADETVRQMQLAQLELYRLSLDTLMDAGVQRISGLQPGRNWADPSGAFAIMTAEIDIEAPYETIQASLQSFVAAHKQGLGVRAVSLTPAPGRPEAPQRSHLTVSLMLPNQSAWKLTPEKSATSPKSAATTPTSAPKTPPTTKPTTVGTKPSLGDL